MLFHILSHSVGGSVDCAIGWMATACRTATFWNDWHIGTCLWKYILNAPLQCEQRPLLHLTFFSHYVRRLSHLRTCQHPFWGSNAVLPEWSRTNVLSFARINVISARIGGQLPPPDPPSRTTIKSDDLSPSAVISFFRWYHVFEDFPGLSVIRRLHTHRLKVQTGKREKTYYHYYLSMALEVTCYVV